MSDEEYLDLHISMRLVVESLSELQRAAAEALPDDFAGSPELRQLMLTDVIAIVQSLTVPERAVNEIPGVRFVEAVWEAKRG
jgi:hypothetical protein